MIELPSTLIAQSLTALHGPPASNESSNTQLRGKTMSSTRDEVLAMYTSYEETAQNALDAANNDEAYEGYDDAGEFLSDWALSVDASITVTVWLTMGGPNAYIECQCSKNGYGTLEIDRAKFFAAWGSDRKETGLSPSDALWQVAERYIEGMEA